MLPQYTNAATEEQKKAVAELMLHCGVAMDMDYNLSAAGGSGAGIFKQHNALTKFSGIILIYTLKDVIIILKDAGKI